MFNSMNLRDTNLSKCSFPTEFKSSPGWKTTNPRCTQPKNQVEISTAGQKNTHLLLGVNQKIRKGRVGAGPSPRVCVGVCPQPPPPLYFSRTDVSFGVWPHTHTHTQNQLHTTPSALCTRCERCTAQRASFRRKIIRGKRLLFFFAFRCAWRYAHAFSHSGGVGLGTCYFACCCFRWGPSRWWDSDANQGKKIKTNRVVCKATGWSGCIN